MVKYQKEEAIPLGFRLYRIGDSKRSPPLPELIFDWLNYKVRTGYSKIMFPANRQQNIFYAPQTQLGEVAMGFRIIKAVRTALRKRSGESNFGKWENLDNFSPDYKKATTFSNHR